MKEEYLKYILAFKKLSTEDKKEEITNQLIDLIKFIDIANKKIDNENEILPVLTQVENDDEYLVQIFTLILALKEENGKFVNSLIDKNLI